MAKSVRSAMLFRKKRNRGRKSGVSEVKVQAGTHQAEYRSPQEIIVGDRFRNDLGDIKGLAASLAEIGQLQPIGVTPDNHLIWGGRRLAAAKRLRWKKILVRVVDFRDRRSAEVQENTMRTPFLPSEIYAIAKHFWPKVSRQAALRERSGRKVQGEKGDTRDIVGRLCGISGTRLGWIMAIGKAVEENPELYGELTDGCDKTGKVIKFWKRLKRMQAAEQSRKQSPRLPSGSVLGLNKFLLGDCRDILPDLPDNSFDAVLTDPPFFGLDGTGKGKPARDDNPKAYWKWLRPIHEEMRRVVRPGGVVGLFQPPSYMRWFWEWFGDDIRIFIVVKKHTAMVKRDYLRRGYDTMVLWWKPGAPPALPADPKASTDFFVSTYPRLDNLARASDHFAPKSADVCEHLVQSLVVEGGVVLDPFGGVGGFALAARATRRRFLAVEAKENYWQVATERLRCQRPRFSAAKQG